MIHLQRVYEKPARHDGIRLLIERLLPRGVRNANLQTVGWQKEADPSNQYESGFLTIPKNRMLRESLSDLRVV